MGRYDDDDYYYQRYDATLPWGIYYIATCIGYCLCAVAALFCIACGLFYLADITEEYSVLTKRVLKVFLMVIMIFFVLLAVVDGISWWRCLFSVAANLSYYRLLKGFPWITLSAPSTVLAGVMFVFDTFLWYTFFHSASGFYPYWSIVSFFMVGCWAAPLGFFVSVALADEQLPMTSPIDVPRGKQQQRKGILASLKGLVTFGR